MALHALGSVTVGATGLVSKSGECEVVYDLLYADAESAATEAGATLPTGPESAAFKKGLARLATTIATYVHSALTTRATAKIATTDIALQRLPLLVVPNENTQGPTVDKFLTIV
jgi:hypothetical protein